ncbi:MAG: lipopolysaccharide heptosyltransferase II [Candidatus Omnitrophota bacterium]
MKILFVTLSNIGDAILTLPVLDSLRSNLASPRITVVATSRTGEIFQGVPEVEEVIVYDKHAPLREKIALLRRLREKGFDAVVDLRNSLLGVLTPARQKTSSLLHPPAAIRHMKDRHLYKISRIISKLKDKNAASRGSMLGARPEDEDYINRLLEGCGISSRDKIVVVGAGARSNTKRWPSDKFLELAAELVRELRLAVILSGDKGDAPTNSYISQRIGDGVFDFSGLTTIPQLASLIRRAMVVVTNDSALLHLASYLDVPVVAIFGPTDEDKYGPWSQNKAVVKKDIFCRPCQKAQCRYSSLKCLQIISVEDVMRQVRKMVDPQAREAALRPNAPGKDFKRILVVRTDRIGDVVLSTPVIRALRDSYPHAYIAMMVSAYAKDVVEGNPCLDEVIIYDKEAEHKGWLGSFKFARNLKKKRFELALILHPANRAHLVTFIAGIPMRVGYDRKLGFLLSDKVKHLKHLGQKHELEYNLDLLRYLGIEADDKKTFMPIKAESERWVENVLLKEGVKPADKLLALHPGASCPSKIWPSGRFAEVADKLSLKHGLKVIILGGPKDAVLAGRLAGQMRTKAFNLAAKTSVSQLASIIRRCRLFISNDSGPVHIASAVGTPVISIFGRSQEGLSPRRWGPLGLKDRILHTKVGCIECLAHNCTKDFACLKAIGVDDVLAAADSILRDGGG